MNQDTVGDALTASQFIMEYDCYQLLVEFGLPVAQNKLAANLEEAIKIAEGIGYPVVLKGMAKEIVHKTEAGVVKINIKNQDELTQCFHEIVENASKNNNVQLDGVLVQEMVPHGTEMIIGIKKDPVFGHQLILGMGGTLVEILKDFSIGLMPVSPEEVEDMISRLKLAPLLKGFRGSQPINVNALKQIVEKLNKTIETRPEIQEMDLNPVIFFDEKAVICDARIFTGVIDENEFPSPGSIKDLRKMLSPRSIAVVGASENEKKNGGRLFRYIVENGFKGDLYPVNPNCDEIRGYKTFKTVKEIPGEVDLACIIVPAPYVAGVIQECIEKGVKDVIIYSSGFSEIGVEGKKRQDEIVSLAKQSGLHVLGPNSIGIASPVENIYTAFGSALESKTKYDGSIGFISQSGAIGSALLSRAWERGVGFSRWVSVGNEAELDATDFIYALADDDSTKVIALFAESIKNKHSFEMSAKKAMESEKPVLVFKTGRSEVGKRSVQSHTGSMAGDDAVYDAAFQKFGVLRMDDLEELIDVSVAFGIQPIPKGNKIGVITASGGICSVIADLCTLRGMVIPQLDETAEAIQDIIPSFGSKQNPIDVTAEIIGKPEMFKKVLQTMVDDRNVDGIIVMLTTNADPGASVIARAILDIFESHSKPIVVGRLGAEAIAPEAMKFYREKRFPVYPTPEKVVNVMSYLVRYGEIRRGRGGSF